MAKRIPQSFIDEVLDKTSLSQLIDEHVPLKKEGANFKACCPFHQEKTPSFYVMEQKGFYHCFGCKQSGNAISFLMDYLQYDFIDALEMLSSRAGMSLPQENVTYQPSAQTLSQKDLLVKVDALYQQNLKVSKEAISYLKARGISGKTAKYFHLGFAKNSWNELEESFPGQQSALTELGMLVKNDKGNIYSRFRNRLMFPIFDRKGLVIAFGGRTLNKEDKPKYLNSPETPLFHKSHELYALNFSKKTKSDALIVVEGYMDVVALFEHGIDNACATLGTSLTTSHLQRLIATRSKLYFCFDGDAAGREAAKRSLRLSLPLLQEGLDLRFVFLPEGEDPDSICQQHGSSYFLKLLEHSTPIHHFFMNYLRENLDLSNMSGRSAFIAKAKPLFETIPASSYRDMMKDELARIARMDIVQLEQHISELDRVDNTSKSIDTKPSIMRQALAILVQNPELFHAIHHHYDFTHLALPGNELFKKLLEILPIKSKTSQILEYFRPQPKEMAVIMKLANTPLSIPNEGLLEELEGAFYYLQQSSTQSQIELLLKKASDQTISDSERILLQKLIRKQKQQEQMPS